MSFDGTITLDLGWDSAADLDRLVVELGGSDGEVIPMQASDGVYSANLGMQRAA